MIFLALALCIAVALALLKSASTGILLSILARAVVDTAWATPLFGPMSPPRIFGAIVPALALLRAAMDHGRFRGIPLLLPWLLFLGYGVIAAFFNLSGGGYWQIPDLIFRLLNGFAGYCLIQAYFSGEKEFRKLLVAMVIAGVFPLLMGWYQLFTGTVWRQTETTGYLTRFHGMYHDLFSMRLYMLQMLTALFLLWSLYAKRSRATLQKALYIALGLGALVIIYRTYSKAAGLILVAWLLIWTVGRRQIALALAVIMLVIVANVMLGGRLFDETSTIYSKEIAALDEAASGKRGTDTQETSLGGRWSQWDVILNEYSNRSVFAMVFGDGRVRAAHNDYLLVLLWGGVVGLLFYCVLLVAIGFRLATGFWRNSSALNTMGVMLFAMWLIDTIGLVPSLYPGYQWYVWGIIGVALRRAGARSPRRVAAIAS